MIENASRRSILSIISQVLFTNPDMTIDVAFRKAVLKAGAGEGGEELEGLTISSIAIYRFVEFDRFLGYC